MAAYINVEKAITWLLTKDSISTALKMPNDKLIVYFYTDGFPWMLWSRYFSGETSIRIKLVEPNNFLSTTLTVCQWLGSDNYWNTSHLAYPTFNQLNEIQ